MKQATSSQNTNKDMQKVFEELEKIKQTLAVLSQKIEDIIPPYGSKNWWDVSNKKALDEVKKKKYITVSNKKDLQVFLDLAKRS